MLCRMLRGPTNEDTKRVLDAMTGMLKQSKTQGDTQAVWDIYLDSVGAFSAELASELSRLP